MSDQPDARSDTRITQLLDAAADGDAQAASDLLPLIYDELRRLAAGRMAGQPADHTLNATALVHEAYLKLIGAEGDQQDRPRWRGRGQFFAAAAQAMRSILVDRARRYAREKHGGGVSRKPEAVLDDTPGGEHDAVELLAVDEALARLDAADPRKARVVTLRYFAGLSIEETAEALELSPATVKNEWLYARAWLHRELKK